MAKGLQLTLWPSKQIACVGATPGTVYTPLSSPLIPGWLWLIVLPLMALVWRPAGFFVNRDQPVDAVGLSRLTLMQ